MKNDCFMEKEKPRMNLIKLINGDWKKNKNKQNTGTKKKDTTFLKKQTKKKLQLKILFKKEENTEKLKNILKQLLKKKIQQENLKNSN